VRTAVATVSFGEPMLCLDCGVLLADAGVKISSIKIENDEWTARGRVEEPMNAGCPQCGKIYKAIMHSIPILCEPFKCPKCDSDESLQYKVKSITSAAEGCEFEASIACKICNKKRSLKRTIKSFFDVVKLKVGPTGITVENA